MKTAPTHTLQKSLTICNISIREQQQECLALLGHPLMQLFPDQLINGWGNKIRHCNTQFRISSYKQQLEKMLLAACKHIGSDE